MAARTAESDLALAYRLQLEEAMAASLALQPSPSNSSLNSPKPSPPISINHALNLADLRTLRINKFERPSGECSSSKNNNSKKNNEDNQEVFRVYFKGLLSEERVPGPRSSNKTVSVAAIGVAICDSKDEMIFEMKKPLDLIKGDRINMKIVEGQALIEALNAAISLNLKRISFYCDCRQLYQYVSGHWRPKQQKIIKILDKVDLFRKCFTHCEPLLIASKDVKFACQLAREAIKSQISKVVSSLGKLEKCVICLDDKSLYQFFSIEGCTHQYCCSCMKQHVEVKLVNGVLPKCPHEGCGNELRIESCGKFLTPEFTEMMRQRLKEDSIPVTEKVYCPYPKCSTLMSRTEVRGLPKSGDGFGARTCYKCHGIFCIKCMIPWHENMSCAEYKRRNPTQLVEKSLLKNLAARNLWRQCNKCKHMIELSAGCYHMTCKCGYEFCYTCGSEWKDKKATCDCPFWVDENIMDDIEEVEHGDVWFVEPN
ncbi:hypothetical protein SSX86_001088 [Deinandra increscens subsp. villosa]|uniref:RBR-type E3 ubiquitin transferase n=1 Tax=Deinandra increscens subsp. villosa TaxID=3103831 RepID=A0AAP0DUQ2_9ASTR